MNVEKLARESINIIKSKFNLPNKGLLAGGSIANIIWELVSGNKAVINDLDIFELDKIESYPEGGKPIFEFKEEEIKYREDHYVGLSLFTSTNDYYIITEASILSDGIINLIKYKSSTSDPMIVIKSFDINCTQIGYSIEDDKFYWTKEFEQFLNTGELKIINLKTPAHTAIRISKKSKELNAELNDFELMMTQHVILYRFTDVLRFGFKERYYKIFIDNRNRLEKYFKLDQDIDKQSYIKINFNDDSKIFRLIPNIEDIDIFPDISRNLIYNDHNINSLYRTDQFLFYMRNIYGKENLKKAWCDLNWFFNKVDYIDTDASERDIKLLNRLSLYAPNTIENLKGYKISEQLEIVKKLLDRYVDDPIIAISILEKIKIDKNIVLDEETSLLLELSVRKEIVNDTKGKVSKILG